MLFTLLFTYSRARLLQTNLIETKAAEEEPEVECVEGEEECAVPETEPTPLEIEEQSLTDSELITIIIGTFLGLIVVITAIVVTCQLCKHRRNLNQKRFLGA